MNDLIRIEQEMTNREKLINYLEHRRLQVIENLVTRYQEKQKRKPYHKILK